MPNKPKRIWRRVNEARLNNGIGATLQASVGLNQTASDVNAAYSDLLNQQRFSFSLQMPIVQWGARSADLQAARAEQDRVTSIARNAREQTAQDAHFASPAAGAVAAATGPRRQVRHRGCQTIRSCVQSLRDWTHRHG